MASIMSEAERGATSFEELGAAVYAAVAGAYWGAGGGLYCGCCSGGVYSCGAGCCCDGLTIGRLSTVKVPNWLEKDWRMGAGEQTPFDCAAPSTARSRSTAGAR